MVVRDSVVYCMGPLGTTVFCAVITPSSSLIICNNLLSQSIGCYNLHLIYFAGSKRTKESCPSLGNVGADDAESPSDKIAPIINKLNENRSKLMSMFSELDKYKCGKVNASKSGPVPGREGSGRQHQLPCISKHIPMSTLGACPSSPPETLSPMRLNLVAFPVHVLTENV